MTTEAHAHPAPKPPTVLRVFVAASTLFILGTGAAAVAAHQLDHAVASGAIFWCVLTSLLLCVPLLVASVKLIRRDDEGPITGIVGAVVGGTAVAVILLGVAALIAFAAACQGGCLQ